MELLSLLDHLLIPIIATIGIVVIALYIISYLNRFFSYLKIKESVFLGENSVQVLEIMLLYSFFSFLFVFLIYIYSGIGFGIRDYTTRIIFPYLYTFFSIILVLLFSMLFLSINNRAFKYLRGELHTKPKTIISEKVGYYTELIIKYFIYFLALIFSIIILLSSFGVLGNTTKGLIIFFSRNVEGLLMILFLIIIGIVLYLIFVAFINDIKLRSKSQKEKLGKYLTGILRNTIIILVLLGIILIFLSMLGFRYADIFVFIFFIIIILIMVFFVFYSPLKNAISGIIILSLEPFVEDDYISIENEIEGTVLNIKLLYTEIKDTRGKINLIPNSKILEKTVRVISSPGKNFPIRFEIEIPGTIGPETFEKIFLESVMDIPYIDQTERPSIFLKNIGSNFDKYEICIHVESSEKGDFIKSEILKRLKSAMYKH
ncbi:MAG: mechanosensitive ion channel domain-containing protein [Thermoplasmata archaeon]